MLTYPAIDPVAFSLGPVKVHWYGLMYLFGFFMAWTLAHFRVKRYQLPWNSAQISDLIFYAALGLLIGARLGYMLFYNSAYFFAKPWSLLQVWEGGMSFHGGLVGVIIALFFYSRQIQKSFLEVGDFVVPLVPIGLAAGRAGNFINGELWGRVTDAPWGMVFPHTEGLPRHPSQLYELGLEGLFLFVLVWSYGAKPRKPGYLSACFLVGYACVRILVECLREPDLQLGFIAFNWVTMGQLLCLPMLFLGLYLWFSKR